MKKTPEVMNFILGYIEDTKKKLEASNIRPTIKRIEDEALKDYIEAVEYEERKLKDAGYFVIRMFSLDDTEYIKVFYKIHAEAGVIFVYVNGQLTKCYKELIRISEKKVIEHYVLEYNNKVFAVNKEQV